jgi:hypothetical protein
LCSTRIKEHRPSSTEHVCFSGSDLCSGHISVSDAYFSLRRGGAQSFSKAKWFSYRRGVIRNMMM